MSSSGIIKADAVLKETGVKKGDTFLDAGCGGGYVAIAASKIVGDEGTVYAADIDEKSISHLKSEIAAKCIPNVTALVADITKRMPLEDGTIDVCLMSNVFHGLVENGEADSSLKEIFRIVKIGGIFTVVEFKKKRSIFGPPFRVKLSPEEVDCIVSPYCFSRRQTAEVSRFHYAVKFVKK